MSGLGSKEGVCGSTVAAATWKRMGARFCGWLVGFGEVGRGDVSYVFLGGGGRGGRVMRMYTHTFYLSI